MYRENSDRNDTFLPSGKFFLPRLSVILQAQYCAAQASQYIFWENHSPQHRLTRPERKNNLQQVKCM